MPKLLIASNRLPVTVEAENGRFELSPSSGGLATGLRSMCQRGDVKWVGWPGETTELEGAAREELTQRLEEHRLAPVYLNREEIAGYYEEIANGVLWPAFHGQIGELPPAPHGWDAYVAANERFAQALLSQYGDGDLIWVQDFHLALVPGMLRRRLDDAAIGFFLHIPFPAYEVFSILPWREQLLEGLLGSDLIGFHTEEHLRNFADAAHRLLGLDLKGDTIVHRGRRTKLGAFPMGIDAASWGARSEDEETLRKVDDLRREASGRNLILGIDRLDYTKGILRRFLTIERLLQMDERLSEGLRFIQVTVPSRQKVEAYASLERQIDETVGRVNARYTSATAVPIHRLHRSISEEELSVLYRATDVMLVTPLRDGMNLVAKEFVASRSDEDGVLILSEFAGAAAELPEALHVNPYDIDGTASVVLRALTMPREERRERMQSMRKRVFEHDVRRWTASFLEELEQSATASRQLQPVAFSSPLEIAEKLRTNRELVLFLDYDGSLVPFADRPEDATPDPKLLDLLALLATRPSTHVFITSGRTKASLDEWFAKLPVGLHAEHGVWTRHSGGEWRLAPDLPVDWMTVVRPILDQIAERVPVTFVEEKTAGYVWHYRMARGPAGTEQAEEVEEQAREVAALLGDFLASSPAEVVTGKGVVEIRPRARHKGSIVRDSIAAVDAPCLAFAVGDDEPDEDLFRALPEGSITVRVGDGPSDARYRLRDFRDVRALLRHLLD